jgi:hypothetical protein
MRENIIKLLFLTFFILPLIHTGCSPTEPSIENIEPGRRDYVWSVDTISSPSHLFYWHIIS